MTALQLNQLSLRNFRCFADCEVNFHPELTVLVAENGSGKTALLDAAAAALSVVVNVLYPPEWVRRIQSSDVRLRPDSSLKMVPQLPTEYDARGIVHNAAVAWGSTARTYSGKLSPSRRFEQVRTIANEFRSNAAILPLVAYYGTARLWREARLTESRRSSLRNIDERVSAYADCLTSSSSFRGVSAWYESRFSQTASPVYKESLTTNLAMIQGVKTACDTVLAPTGWSNLNWDSDLHIMTAEHEVNGRLPLSMLSDGVRTMLALVADVARRCVSLNPQLSDRASIKTPGVLIVDELDMHLHPRWQQQVLGLLQSAFPALQIIVSTHSPHVLSTVDKASIRVVHLSNGQVEIETPGLQTRGVESADVLASVMGVDPIPQIEEVMDLSEYKAMIEDGKADAEPARALRAKLVEHFGASHPVLVDCDRLIRFQQFRLRREGSAGA
jgi:predicted ATP-binding protein involved in virulence